MKTLFSFVASLLLVTALVSTTNAQTFYGDKITAKGAKKSTELSKMPTKADSLTDVKVTGKVTSVCKKKGCWMKMDMGGKELMIRFKDYGFFVPKDCDGKTATIQGKVKKEVIDVATLRHYAEDAGKTKEEIEKITKPEEKYTFEAVGVILK
jgi:hypothetical protein